MRQKPCRLDRRKVSDGGAGASISKVLPKSGSCSSRVAEASNALRSVPKVDATSGTTTLGVSDSRSIKPSSTVRVPVQNACQVYRTGQIL